MSSPYNSISVCFIVFCFLASCFIHVNPFLISHIFSAADTATTEGIRDNTLHQYITCFVVLLNFVAAVVVFFLSVGFFFCSTRDNYYRKLALFSYYFKIVNF